MAFTGPLFESLHKLVTLRFNANSLDMFVNANIEGTYNPAGADMFKEWVGQGISFGEQVKQLLKGLDACGRLLVFVEKLIEKRDDFQKDGEIKDLLIRARAALLAADSSKDNVAAVKTGVDSMASHLQNEKVQGIVCDFKNVLVLIAEKINLLNGYKNLHDVLHTAKEGFGKFSQPAKLIKKEETKFQDFKTGVREMSYLAEDMPALTEVFPTTPVDLRQPECNWIADFKACVDLGQKAVDTRDDIVARQSVQKLKSLLSAQLARIDTKIGSTAKELDLVKFKELFDAASGVPELDKEKSLFNEGSAAAERLRSQIDAQVTSHAQWQAVDSWLLGTDENLSKLDTDDAGDFAGFWKEVEDRVMLPISASPDSVWAKRFMPQLSDVNAAFAASNWDLLRSNVDAFRSAERRQFFVVDTNLKNLADEVSDLGMPLQALLQKL